MAKRKAKAASKKPPQKQGWKEKELGILPMSNLKIAYPANNLPSSVSDRDIREAIRSINAAHFRKSSV